MPRFSWGGNKSGTHMQHIQIFWGDNLNYGFLSHLIEGLRKKVSRWLTGGAKTVFEVVCAHCPSLFFSKHTGHKGEKFTTSVISLGNERVSACGQLSGFRNAQELISVSSVWVVIGVVHSGCHEQDQTTLCPLQEHAQVTIRQRQNSAVSPKNEKRIKSLGRNQDSVSTQCLTFRLL